MSEDWGSDKLHLQITPRVAVKVYLNETGGFMEYTAGDALREAASFHCDLPSSGEIEGVLDIVWGQLNVDYPKADWAIKYRAERNRSLSMGDVVMLGESAWTPMFVGWRRVTDLVLQ